jgi:hypothetical protein
LPSFICCSPIVCKPPASWSMPSVSFDFHCYHAPARSARTFCSQCNIPYQRAACVLLVHVLKQAPLRPTSASMHCRVAVFCSPQASISRTTVALWC